tara:strand:- start:373 stop:546 length:174 start_codon:yes stop_codon:yes gene_type:complete
MRVGAAYMITFREQTLFLKRMGSERGSQFNLRLVEAVIAWSRRFLGDAAPLETGSHA